MNRSGAVLEHVWSKGPDAPLDDLKQGITLLVKASQAVTVRSSVSCASESHLLMIAAWMLQEYLLSADLIEAAACVKALASPHYHHEGATAVVWMPPLLYHDFA